MNDLEKFNTLKANKLCHNCFQGDHFMSKDKSKNTCFKNDCSAKHQITLHEYSTSNQRDRRSKKWRSQTKFKHEKGRGQKSVIYRHDQKAFKGGSFANTTSKG